MRRRSFEKDFFSIRTEAKWRAAVQRAVVQFFEFQIFIFYEIIKWSISNKNRGAVLRNSVWTAAVPGWSPDKRRRREKSAGNRAGERSVGFLKATLDKAKKQRAPFTFGAPASSL